MKMFSLVLTVLFAAAPAFAQQPPTDDELQAGLARCTRHTKRDVHQVPTYEPGYEICADLEKEWKARHADDLTVIQGTHNKLRGN